MNSVWNTPILFLSVITLCFSVEIFSYLFGNIKSASQTYLVFIFGIIFLIGTYYKISIIKSIIPWELESFTEYTILGICYLSLYFFDRIIVAICFSKKVLRKKKLSYDIFVVISMSILEEIIYRDILVKLINIHISNTIIIAITTSLAYAFNHRYLTRNLSRHNKYYHIYSKFVLGILFFVITYEFGLFYAMTGHIIYNIGIYSWRE